MNFVEKLNTGIHPPEDINVVIEISKGSNIKYELNLDNGILSVSYTHLTLPTIYSV